ncbi:MAG: hypothetical protein FWH29_00265 [Methanobrevibacter sp.]|nr:hypothetical protein [Methanobrevibacter sp.]
MIIPQINDMEFMRKDIRYGPTVIVCKYFFNKNPSTRNADISKIAITRI